MTGDPRNESDPQDELDDLLPLAGPSDDPLSTPAGDPLSGPLDALSEQAADPLADANLQKAEYDALYGSSGPIPAAPQTASRKQGKRRKHEAAESTFSPQACAIGGITSFLVYAVVVGVITLDPKSSAKMHEAFGDHFLGMPVITGLVVVGTILFLPIPVFMYYTTLVILHEQQNHGRSLRLIGFLIRASSIAKEERHLRFAVLMALAGLFYVIVIAGSWIVYASSQGV